MQKLLKSKAEEKFAAIQKKSEEDMKERAAHRQTRMELTLKLRALRHEKEAAEKKAAEEAKSAKSAKIKKPKKSAVASKKA
ncbi:MAG: hypothetical protein ACRBBN_11305 [Methyloligellaceae bacterium]